MWGLVATAAAGLEAGHGLASVIKHNALMEDQSAYAAAFAPMTTASATTCSALSAVATGASLAAYFSESDANRDPAYLTAAVLAGLPIVYSMLVLGPAKVALENKSLDVRQRESYLKAWGVKKSVGFALSLLPFAGLLLVVSAGRDERNVGGVKF